MLYSTVHVQCSAQCTVRVPNMSEAGSRVSEEKSLPCSHSVALSPGWHTVSGCLRVGHTCHSSWE